MSGALLDISGLCIQTSPNRNQPGKARVRVLDGVDLQLDRGQVIGLIGESGAGKSTLGLSAMGYARRGLEITEGSILLDGQELRDARPEVLRNLRGRKVAYVAQSAAAAFNPAHKLLEQVTEVTRIHNGLDHGSAQQRAVKLFGRMGLPHPDVFGQSYPHEVSGGQLQRAMTAMALAGRPDLLIFDEPTTALDVTTQIDVLAIIKEVIRDVGSAAIYITHDLGVVAQIADRIKVLRNGQEVEEQDTADLLTSPREDYTRDLLNVRGHTITGSGQSGSDNVLHLNSIHGGYRAKQVLFGVSFSLKRKTSLAIVGESGSGKSTLARVIMGLLPQTQGDMLFEGAPLSPELAKRDPTARKRIQMIYQLPDVAMNPRQTIARIIGRAAEVFLGVSRSEGRRKAADYLEQVDLPVDLLERYPNQLSGGQKQRVCIARALAAEPDVIICDEVTSALDPLVADGIVKLLLTLQQQKGISYIFITHDMAMVEAIADHVVVMQGGRVVEQGAKADIFSPPHADYTHLLITSTPEMRQGWLEQAIEERRMDAGGH